MFAVGKDSVSLLLLALSAMVWEGTEAARTINNVIGGLEIASIIGELFRGKAIDYCHQRTQPPKEAQSEDVPDDTFTTVFA